MSAMTAPQQFSPDGQWWWDGAQWLPAAQAPSRQPAPYQPPYGSQPPYGGPPPYGYAPPPKSTDGKAIGSLIASLLWVFGVGSAVAVVLGHLSRSQARREGREPSGLAMAGLVIGYLGIAAAGGIILLLVAFGSDIVDNVKTDVELQTAAYAQQDYHDTNGRYATTLEELRPYGYDDLDGVIDITVVSAGPTSFCFSGHSFGKTFYVSDEHPDVANKPCS
jgi:hypothetical protein